MQVNGGKIHLPFIEKQIQLLEFLQLRFHRPLTALLLEVSFRDPEAKETSHRDCEHGRESSNGSTQYRCNIAKIGQLHTAFFSGNRLVNVAALVIRSSEQANLVHPALWPSTAESPARYSPSPKVDDKVLLRTLGHLLV